MDRLKKPKEFLNKLRLTDSDYQDSGMINHIADLLERYSTEQLNLCGVRRSAFMIKDKNSGCVYGLFNSEEKANNYVNNSSNNIIVQEVSIA